MECLNCLTAKPFFYYWKGAKVILAACPNHLYEMVNVLNRSQDKNKEGESLVKHLDKIGASFCTLAIITEEALKSEKIALELGYSLLIGKPIILLIKRDCLFPSKLMQIADAIEYVDHPEDMPFAAEKALKRLGL